MLRRFLLIITLGSLTLIPNRPAFASSPDSPPPQEKTSAIVAANYGKLPLSFTANQGQTDSRVKFTSQGDGYSLFLTDSEAVLELSKRVGKEHAGKTVLQQKLGPPSRLALKTDVVRMQLAGAEPGLKVSGEAQLPGKANYFIGNDPAKWHTDIPTFSGVKYTGVYPGVDLVYYGNQQQLEYDFVVAPGTDPSEIKLQFTGATLALNANGDLLMKGKHGQIAFHKPVVYQLNSGLIRNGSPDHREQINGRFTLLSRNTVGFTLGSYDKSKPVVIDPTLAYSTYLGGSGLRISQGETVGDSGAAIAVDASGCAYVTGAAASADFPVTKDAFQTSISWEGGGGNAFVTKLNSTGTALEYSTYLGGVIILPYNKEGYVIYRADAGKAIAVDSVGEAYVAGIAESSDFPTTPEAFQKVNRNSALSNAFVTKLNSQGNGLVYSTYLGGSNGGNAGSSVPGDYATGIAINATGHAYVTGFAPSTDFPVTPLAFQTINKAAASHGSNAFVTKLTASGSGLLYSTYLGGSHGASDGAGDTAFGIAIDSAGDAYVVGYALSQDFPTTPNAFQLRKKGQYNVFVTKLNGSGMDLLYSTFLGGSSIDQGNGIAVDASGQAYVTGYAMSANFPTTPGSFQPVFAAGPYGKNAFVTKLNRQGTSLVYSTFLGCLGVGNGAGDSGSGIAVDATGHVFVTGSLSCPDFPTTEDAFEQANGNVFLTKLNAHGTALEYSTRLGGSGNDGGSGIALDAGENAYLTGTAYSADFPVSEGAFQVVNHSDSGNSFVTKFSW